LAEEDANKAHWHFLVNANDFSQYAIYYGKGHQALHLSVFSEKGERTQLKPGQTVYAFDDVSELDTENQLLKIKAYQISRNTDLGKDIKNILEVGVDFKISFEVSLIARAMIFFPIS